MGSKSIWFNLDGTLLDSQGQISQDSLQTLDLLRKANFKIGIATNQPMFMIKQEIKSLKPDLPIISINGALVSKPIFLRNKKYENIFCESIKPNEARNIYHYLVKNESDFLVYTDQEAFYYNPSKKSKPIENIKKTLANFTLAYRYDFLDLVHFDFNPDNHKILKFLVFTDYYDAKQLRELKKYLGEFKESYCANSLPNILDISSIKASKGQALKLVSESYDLNLSKSFAFGDSENDLSMFKKVAFSVAMKNAPFKVRKEAWATTWSDNNHNGVKKFVHWKILNKTASS